MVGLRKFLLIYWSVLALLGHAGTHALADYLGVCVHVETQDAATVPSGVVAGKVGRSVSGHAGCQHCLRQQRKLSAAAGVSGDCGQGTNDHSGSHSGHDSANCRLCDWFLKFTPQGLSEQPCLLPEPTVVFSDIVSVDLISAAAPPARSRGPPSPRIV